MTLIVEAFGTFGPADQAVITAEGLRLLSFAAPGWNRMSGLAPEAVTVTC